MNRTFSFGPLKLTRRGFLKGLGIATVALAAPWGARESSGVPKGFGPMPVLFVGHGSPLNAVEATRFADEWGWVGENLQRPLGILCVSAHWVTDGVRVTTHERPETIHDFDGFPELLSVRYPAPGSRPLAETVIGLSSEVAIARDPDRGLDHGCWSVLMRLFPKADVPVVQLSLDRSAPAGAHYEFARCLAPLRNMGFLILCSGNIVHNSGLSREGASPYPWAAEFDALVKELIQRGDHRRLVRYRELGEAAVLSVPTPEHYLPVLYATALRKENEPVFFFNEEIVSGAVSMRSFQVGELTEFQPTGQSGCAHDCL